MQICGCNDITKTITETEKKENRFKSSFVITENGFNEIELWIKEEKGEIPLDMPLKSSVNGFCDNSIVEVLQNQLKAKDEQLKALNEQLTQKDNIINSLLEQTKNFQVLLQGQQMLSLPEKKSFIKRIFNK